MQEKLSPFDWTFTTDYKGTLSEHFSVETTQERIDVERLKQKESILFYQDMPLYEDELHDNGIAACTLKMVSIYKLAYFNHTVHTHHYYGRFGNLFNTANSFHAFLIFLSFYQKILFHIENALNDQFIGKIQAIKSETKIRDTV